MNTAVGHKDRGGEGGGGRKGREGLQQGQWSKQPVSELREAGHTVPAAGMVPLQSNTGSAGAAAVNHHSNVCLCVLSRVGRQGEDFCFVFFVGEGGWGGGMGGRLEYAILPQVKC